MQSKKDDNSLSLTLARTILIVAAIVTLVLTVLQIMDIFKNGTLILTFLYIVILLCMSRLKWNEHRGHAYFLLGCAIFLFIGFIVLLLLG